MKNPKKSRPSDDNANRENLDSEKSVFSSSKSGEKYSSRHDEFFKRSVGNERFCPEFMATTLPSEFGQVFDFPRLRKAPTDFFPPMRGAVRSDLTLFVPIKPEFAQNRTVGSQSDAVVTLIVEHKAQSGSFEDAHTVAQAGLYAFAANYQRVVQRIRPFLSPIAAIVYNGSNPDIDHFAFGEHFSLPEKLALWQIGWTIPCVNLTRLYLDNKIVGSPVVQSLCLAMGAAGSGELQNDIGLPFDPLRRVDDWDDPVYRDYSEALVVYIERETRERGCPVSWDRLNEAAKRGIPRKVRSEMKKLFDLGVERGELRGERRGERKGSLNAAFDSVQEFLTMRYGSESDALLQKIKKVKDLSVLKAIRRLSFGSDVLEQIERGVDQILEENPNATRPPRTR
ncbi:MAG: hypothetical protein IJM30_07100 [Thermoguttaceae bacterium]|nr:hypothetical protein [Thermoguttaceae bacterium]